MPLRPSVRRFDRRDAARCRAQAAESAMQAARGLNGASTLLAGSVLLDSAVEHYRGGFHNKAMYAPLITSALSILAGAHGSGDRRSGAHPARDAIYAGAALVGLIGTGAHLYNIGKKPGGFSLQNLFYSAPVGAPAALILAGMMGVLAERVRDDALGDPPKIAGLPAGRVLSALTGLGLLGTVGEAGLLHYRGAYQNPLMFLPVSVPPVAAALLGAASVGEAERPHGLTRWWLRATATLGVVGAGLHIYGVSRAMGGWRNWTQNLIDGPPIPAPPAFTGLALAGLAALGLLEETGP